MLTKPKRIEGETNGDKDGKTLYKIMNNVVYGKTMKNLRYRVDIKLLSNKKNYLKWTLKTSYMSQNMFDNNLVAICKNKVTLTPNKPACVGVCILKMNKV